MGGVFRSTLDQLERHLRGVDWARIKELCWLRVKNEIF